jgi:hypothetical protein
METFLILTALILFLDSQLQPPPIVEPPIEEKTQEVREVPKDAVNVAEVMALKEVLEKVVDLQKKEGEQ